MNGEYKKNGCIIHVDNTLNNPVSAWVDNGQTVYYIKPTERDMFRFNPQQALMYILHKVNKGIVRCSKCGWEGKKEEFKRGYMAEILCSACSDDSEKIVENDIATGNRCLECGAPRSRCYC